MEEEDYEVLRAESDADRPRFNEYDPHQQFKREYSKLHPDQREALSRTVTEAQSNASSSSSIQIQEIRSNNAGRSMTRTRTRTEEINYPLERDETALSRIETHRTQHATTVGMSAISTRSSKKEPPLPPFGAGKPYPPPLPAREEFVVEFEGQDDPLYAMNWPMKKKLIIGSILAFDSLAATMGSSIFSDATRIVSSIYGVSTEVGTLTTSLFVLGYAFGPIIWAPMSELYGRRLPILFGAFGFSVFALATATAENLQTIMLGRFFSGLFGSCPLAVVAAVFADMFNNKARGLAVAVFSATVFMGPLLAPFIGGFIVDSYLGWRWTAYISSIMGWAALILCLIFLEESYPPVILVSKASELRRRTKNWGIHAKQEEIEVDFRELIVKNVSRPLRILFTEPIVLAVTIYMSFIYGLLYLFLTAYAIVFQQIYGFNAGVGGLPYFGMVLGEIIGFITVVLLNPGYIKKLEANSNVPVPEWRVPLAIAGGLAFAGGLFWFGWTGYQGTLPWIVPTLSGLLTGFGIFTVFLQMLNYIIDAYLMFAASALAANTFLRSIFGAIFPLFATYMFAGIGVNWTLTLLGCVALLMVPMPIIFLLYGKRIRKMSKFAPAPDIKLDEQRRADEEAKIESSGGESASDELQRERTTNTTGAREEVDEAEEAEELEEVEEVEEVEELEKTGKEKKEI